MVNGDSTDTGRSSEKSSILQYPPPQWIKHVSTSAAWNSFLITRWASLLTSSHSPGDAQATHRHGRQGSQVEASWTCAAGSSQVEFSFRSIAHGPAYRWPSFTFLAYHTPPGEQEQAAARGAMEKGPPARGLCLQPCADLQGGRPP